MGITKFSPNSSEYLSGVQFDRQLFPIEFPTTDEREAMAVEIMAGAYEQFFERYSFNGQVLRKIGAKIRKITTTCPEFRDGKERLSLWEEVRKIKDKFRDRLKESHIPIDPITLPDRRARITRLLELLKTHGEIMWKLEKQSIGTGLPRSLRQNSDELYRRRNESLAESARERKSTENDDTAPLLQEENQQGVLHHMCLCMNIMKHRLEEILAMQNANPRKFKLDIALVQFYSQWEKLLALADGTITHDDLYGHFTVS